MRGNARSAGYIGQEIDSRSMHSSSSDSDEAAARMSTKYEAVEAAAAVRKVEAEDKERAIGS